MTIDEKLEARMEAQGYDLQDEVDAREFQERLDRILEQERKKAQQMPPRQVERIRGIMV
jgi:hypothetical protein